MDYCPKKNSESAVVEDVDHNADEEPETGTFSSAAQGVEINCDREPVSSSEEQTLNETNNGHVPEVGSSNSAEQASQALSQPEIEDNSNPKEESSCSKISKNSASNETTRKFEGSSSKPDDDIYFGLVKTLPDRWFRDIYTPMEKLVLDAIKADSGQLVSIPKLVKVSKLVNI